ncbi:ribosome biogenesis protein ERB1-like [Macadamia integrifolia]|uniref:ribosome biogenesis protein ERB1-like n=1 Tax=Macadamia integrifolia TaxID=60698 RepID=UPI001C4F2148|nr:ribosome biogenesis protein ERB1-like [Macadamia integrifolia]
MVKVGDMEEFGGMANIDGVVKVGSMAEVEGEFEGHEESDEEPSERDISEEEDDEDDDEDESEDGDDNNDSNSRSDDEYQDWDDNDYQGPWDNNEDDKSGYYSPRDPGGYSVYAIGKDDLMIDPIDAIQSARTIHAEGDELALYSEDSEGYEITFESEVNPIAEHMTYVYSHLVELKLEANEIDQILGEVAISEHYYTEQLRNLEKAGGHDTLVEMIDTVVKLLEDGYQGYLVSVIDVDAKVTLLEELEVVKEFPDIFLNDLTQLPPNRELEFTIELIPGAISVSKAPYIMAPAELKELQTQLQDLLKKEFIHPSVSPWGVLVLFAKKKDGSLSFSPTVMVDIDIVSVIVLELDIRTCSWRKRKEKFLEALSLCFKVLMITVMTFKMGSMTM